MPPGINGLEVTRKLLRYAMTCKILILTIDDSEIYTARLLQAGASGYLTKDCYPAEMIRAIRIVSTGQHYISPTIAQKIAIKRFTGHQSALVDALSHRELQIMLMIVQGQKTTDIANALYVSPKTINTYRYRIFKKLEVHSDVELVRLAIQLGILNLTPEEQQRTNSASMSHKN